MLVENLSYEEILGLMKQFSQLNLKMRSHYEKYSVSLRIFFTFQMFNQQGTIVCLLVVSNRLHMCIDRAVKRTESLPCQLQSGCFYKRFFFKKVKKNIFFNRGYQSVVFNCNQNMVLRAKHTAQQKHESTLLHTYVLNEFLTADRS